MRCIFPAITMAMALSAQAAVPRFRIVTLSSRPEMISGGNVLVRIDLPGGASGPNVVVRLNGEEVTSDLHPVHSGRAIEGLIPGLQLGENRLEVFGGSTSRPAAELTLVDHPISGPVFSGPQQHPFICQTQDFRLPDGTLLGPPTDSDCSVKTVITYMYKSTGPAPRSVRRGGPLSGPPPLYLKPLKNLTPLPADVAYTTTTTGLRVPFLLRIETGTINRGIYQIAVLMDPSKPSGFGPLDPDPAWNRRLVYSFGGGCPGGGYKQGATVGMFHGVLDENVVGKGYAEASSSLNVFGNDCDAVIAAETMMMVKEQFIKEFGPPAFTFSFGGSGGAEQQVPIADTYPGLLDGIIPSMTFPDVLTLTQNLFDTALLNAYFAKTPLPFTKEQKLAITGEGVLWDPSALIGRINPTKNCPAQMPEAERYNALHNRTGARCDIFDYAVNVYGRDPATRFARRPLDNTGVQYGLAALNQGKITPAQFIDLNEKTGGYDSDGNPEASRTAADPLALRRAYEAGVITNGGMGLARVPIIDVRPYLDMVPTALANHQKYFSYALRARLRRENGTDENDVLLVANEAQFSQVNAYAIREMDQWLTHLRKDHSNAPILQKILRAKPADLVDSCWKPEGQRIREPQQFAAGECNTIYPAHRSPRMIAGEPMANDILKCQLKPLDRAGYSVKFTNAEWGQMRTIFPKGVCDWTKPGAGQRSAAGSWLQFPLAAPAAATRARRIAK